MEIRIDFEDDYINDLKIQAGEKKTNKVVAEALALYKWAVGQKKKGRDILSSNADGSKVQQVILPGLDRVAKL